MNRGDPREAGEVVQVSFEYDELGNVARMREGGAITDSTATADRSHRPAGVHDAGRDARAARMAASLLLDLVNAARSPWED